jgi:SAM-dependent methyltransferase
VSLFIGGYAPWATGGRRRNSGLFIATVEGVVRSRPHPNPAPGFRVFRRVRPVRRAGCADPPRERQNTCVTDRLSPRLAAVVDALPLRPGIRVLEIGCGPGAAARAIANRIGDGHILAIDRSATAVRQAIGAAGPEIAAGRMSVRLAAVEKFALEPGDAPYDLAFAIRVGALDGRHPELMERAISRVARALVPGGRLLIDGGDPLREVELPR